MAKMAQLMMEYDPQPPFNAGNPNTAEPEVIESLLQFGKPLIDAFLSQTKVISSQLK